MRDRLANFRLWKQCGLHIRIENQSEYPGMFYQHISKLNICYPSNECSDSQSRDEKMKENSVLVMIRGAIVSTKTMKRTKLVWLTDWKWDRCFELFMMSPVSTCSLLWHSSANCLWSSTPFVLWPCRVERWRRLDWEFDKSLRIDHKLCKSADQNTERHVILGCNSFHSPLRKVIDHDSNQEWLTELEENGDQWEGDDEDHEKNVFGQGGVEYFVIVNRLEHC